MFSRTRGANYSKRPSREPVRRAVIGGAHHQSVRITSITTIIGIALSVCPNGIIADGAQQALGKVCEPGIGLLAAADWSGAALIQKRAWHKRVDTRWR